MKEIFFKSQRANKRLSSLKTLLYLSFLAAVTYQQSFATFTSQKQVTSDVLMKWKFEGDDVILYFEKTTKGHLWIGYGSSMAKADVYKITKTSGGNDLTIEDCYVAGYVTPTCSENNDIVIQHKEATANSLKVQIKRKKVTGDTAKDIDVSGTGNSIIYSYTDNDAPEKHTSKYGVVSVDFSKTNGGDSASRSKWGNGKF